MTERNAFIILCPAPQKGVAYLFNHIEADGIFSDKNQGEALYWFGRTHMKYCAKPAEEHYISPTADPFEWGG